MRVKGFLVNTFVLIAPLLSVTPLLSHADQVLILDPMQWQFLGTSPSPSPYPIPSQQYLIYSYAQFSSLVQGYFGFAVQSPIPPGFSPAGISVFLPSNARVGTMNESYLSLSGAEAITVTANTLNGLECGYVVSGDGNNFPSNFVQIPSVPYTFNIPFGKDLYAQFACRNSGYSDITMSIISIKVQLNVMPQYKLSLSLSQGQVYPDMSDIGQTPGGTDSVVTAKLTTSSGSPVSGKTIQFSIAPKDGSGGHTHSIGRPIGDFKNDKDFCTTLNDGTCSVIYSASQFGGVETISGMLADNSSVKDSQDLTVRVPGLSPLSGGPYTFKCVVFPNAPACLPSYGHSSTYNVVSSVDSAMFVIGSVYSSNFPNASLLVVNDASLSLGGLYDKNGNWQTPHTYHRAGTDIDVRSLTTISPYGIPQDNRDSFELAVCFAGGFPKLEYKDDTQNEHYHLYFNAYKPSILDLCSDEESQ